MGVIERVSASEAMTHEYGERLARWLSPGDIICCFGDLGTGKTTLIKGIAHGLGLRPEEVTSPTFVVMNVYESGRLPLYHFDLYRLERPEELGDIGYEEFLYGRGVAVVEWAERLGPLMPAERMDIHLSHEALDERRIRVDGQGSRYRGLCRRWLAAPRFPWIGGVRT